MSAQRAALDLFVLLCEAVGRAEAEGLAPDDIALQLADMDSGEVYKVTFAQCRAERDALARELA